VTSDRFISIVEDDESLRDALVGLLRSVGYAARGFACAEDFLAVQDGRCGCVITDIRMPGLSGIEMTAQLRRSGFEVPVIMITARDDPALEQQARAGGALCILRKPFESEALLDCVERALAA
jgi:FixJ family two-component response regulator